MSNIKKESIQKTGIDKETQYRVAPFPINGQGIFIYTDRNKESFSIYTTPKELKEGEEPYDFEYIVLHLTETYAQFAIKMKDNKETLLCESYNKNIGINLKEMTSYWFSYDRDKLILKYGKGHVMEETTLMTHSFLRDETQEEQAKIRKKYRMLFNAETKKSVFLACSDEKKKDGVSSLLNVSPCLQFREHPFISNYPPLVMDSTKITLFDLDRSEYTFSASLPLACQELYSNIKNLTLEYPENVLMKLSDAIRYSIETPKMELYEKLREKSRDFPYLRVTLGPDYRTAPGIPYVLEIWPSGSKSPVHNHGGSCAIIKNLFGRITVNIHNKMKDPPEEEEPLKVFDLKEDQITWISPNWYQTHRLVNNTDDFCATIQCYRYDFKDTIHWTGFDVMEFVDDKEYYELNEFLPNSDFTFIRLRSIVMKEYQEYLQRPNPYI